MPHSMHQYNFMQSTALLANGQLHLILNSVNEHTLLVHISLLVKLNTRYTVYQRNVSYDQFHSFPG
jgi:hypothetical protein